MDDRPGTHYTVVSNGSEPTGAFEEVMNALEPVTISGGRGRRSAAFWLLLAQFGAALLIPAADAVLEARSSAESVHLESGEVECSTHHDSLYCQTVRSLTVQVGAAPPASLADAEHVFLLADLGNATTADRRAIPVGPVGPRAPPSV